MRIKIAIIGFMFCWVHLQAQYDISAMQYGVVAVKTTGSIGEVGLGLRAEYAFNCSTTFLAEFNRIQNIDNDITAGYSEFAAGINMILFNWYPTTITAGIGYIGNNSAGIEEIEDGASLALGNKNYVHGAQIKLRAIHRLSAPVHIFAEINLKSLGNQYHNFLIGWSYDFGYK